VKKMLQITLGIITSVGGFLEIGSVTTAVQAGASFQYQLLWAILLGTICLIFLVEMSGRLAADVRNAYHRMTGEPYSDYVGTRGLDVRTDLGGLNLSTVPKVFIECGNMRNSADAARLTSPRFRERIAVALAAGFTTFLNSHS